MELLLWMWFYDPRWFFNIKISIKCHKYIWLLPLFSHIFLVIYCLRFILVSHNNLKDECGEQKIVMWAISRIFFSVFISITIIVFMFKISFVFNREKKYFENAENIYPTLKDHIEPYNFWIRRKSLISTPGILLLFLGLISLFWSYLILKMYITDQTSSKCDLITFLILNNIFIFIGNIPLILLFIFLIGFRLIYFMCAFLCPSTLIWFSKFSKQRKIEHMEKMDNSISY